MSIAVNQMPLWETSDLFHQENEDKIRGSIRSSASSSVKIYCVNCGPFLKKIERAIFISLEDRDRSCHGTVQGGV